jgi:hypothetical protein
MGYTLYGSWQIAVVGGKDGLDANTIDGYLGSG